MRRIRSRALLPGLVPLIAVLALIGVCAPVAAQTPLIDRLAGIVSQREQEYNSARAERDALADQWDAGSVVVQGFIDQAATLALRGDPAVRAADRTAVAAGFTQARLTTRLNNAERTLDQKRRAYQEAIDDYLDQLDVQVGRSSGAEVTGLRRTIARYQYILTTLQPAPPRADWAQTVFRDPRDSPTDLIRKADVVKRLFNDGATTIARAQVELDRLKRLRQQQQLSGSTTLGTFDENTAPVGNAGRVGGAGTTGRGVPEPSLTVDQQIEQWEAWIKELKSRQTQLQARELEFRRLAAPGGR